MRNQKLWSLLTVAALGIGVAAQADVNSGEEAPDFTLTDSNGNEHSLSDFEGKYVVLEWTNYQCPFVKKHYKEGHMQELQEKYTDKGVVWLSICSSAPGKQGHKTAEGWNEQLDEHEANPTALLIDEEGNVGKTYGAKTTPHMYVIDPEGTLIYQGAIDSNPSWQTSDIEDAENYVVAALSADMNDKDVANASTKPYGCGVKY